MIVLGLNGIENLFHDASATLIIDNEIVASVEEERFNRNKHSNGLPTNAIKYCLKKAGVSFSEIDHIGYYLDHVMLKKTFVDNIVAHFGCSPSGLQYYVDAARNIAGLKEKLSREFSLSSKTKLHYLNHHLSHASSAYYISGFDEAAVLTIDGSGDRETSTLYYGDGPDLKKVCDFLVYPESLGFIYTVFAAHLGLGWIEGPGKLMGLAGYGTPDACFLEDILCLKNDPYHPISVDLSFFDYHTGGSGFTQKGLDRFGPVRKSGDRLMQKHCDLAASVQRMLEKVILHIISMIPDLIPSAKNLCFGGGVALNVCANRRIIDSGVFEKIFVTPPAYDGGTSLGCALYLNTKYTGHHNYKFDVYSGPNITKDYYIKEVLDRFVDKITWQEITEDEICVAAANDLSRNMIIGWAHGGMECGPRALGNRSILTNAMNPFAKDDLNNRVKKREGFRPYAPSVLDDYAGQWFDLPTESPFMLFEARVQQDKREVVPGIVHVDGTARPQTVTKENNPQYYRLIKNFHDITGVPMVLNTSFNRHGEPVVNTPEEALCVFLETGMDALYLGNYRILKQREIHSESVYGDVTCYDNPPLPANTFEWALDCECKDLIMKFGSRYTEGMKIRRIMDFASGSNEEITELATEAEEYYFLDEKFLPSQKPRYFRIKHSAGARIPLPDNYLDVVTTNGSFDHFTQEDRIKAFLEIERVLRPGGLFLFACEYMDFERSNGNIFKMSQKDPDIVGRNCQMYDNIDLLDICSKLNNLKIWQADSSVLPDGRPLRELATSDRAKYYRGESKCGTEIIWGSFIVVFSKEIIGGKKLFVTPENSHASLSDKKELTGEKNMGDNGDNDYSGFSSRLRDKWIEVPGTRQGRVFSSEMLKWPDDQLLSFWEDCKKETCVLEVRGWYQNVYKDMFRGCNIADVGPGVGLDGIFFAQHGANVTFVDIVEDNLKLLERICKLKGIEARYYYIDDFFNFKFEDNFDAFLFVGSLINAPFDFTKRQVNAMTSFLKTGGKIAMLAYPKERYEQSGAMDFAEFGKMTDGERTPWCEWYGDEKISALFGNDFRLEWSRDFGKDNIEFNWFDLTKTGNPDVNCNVNEPSSLWFNFRGEHLFRNGSPEDAIETFTKAVNADPDLAIALNNIGVCYWSNGEIEQTKKYFLKALEIDQNDRDTVLNSIKVNVALSDIDEANKIYADYLKNNGEDEEMSRILAEVHLPGKAEQVIHQREHKGIPFVSVTDLQYELGFIESSDNLEPSSLKPFDEWQMEIDDAPIFRYIYRNHKPRRHLEFGTWQGNGTVYCLEECNASVWTINLPFGENRDDQSAAYGHYENELQTLKVWAEKIGLDNKDSYKTDSIGFIGRQYLDRQLGKRVCQIYCDSREWDISNYPAEYFDSVLIDGGHTKDIVLNDTVKALHLLRSGGIILWHDFCPPMIKKNENVRGVVHAIMHEFEGLTSIMSKMFWIYPSMILCGIKQ